MKKMFTVFLLQLAFGVSLFAQQTVASDFYFMKSQQDADLVAKAINAELHLSEPAMTQLKDLLSASAKSQQEQLRLQPNEEKINVIKARQTAHIENNLKRIFGAETFSLYNQKKAAIEKQLKTSQKD